MHSNKIKKNKKYIKHVEYGIASSCPRGYEKKLKEVKR